MRGSKLSCRPLWATTCPSGSKTQLPLLSTLRPRLLAPVWLEGLLERGCPTPGLRRLIKRQWDQTIEAYLDLDLVRGTHSLEPDRFGRWTLIAPFRSAIVGREIGRAKSSSGSNSCRGASSSSYVTHRLGRNRTIGIVALVKSFMDTTRTTPKRSRSTRVRRHTYV